MIVSNNFAFIDGQNIHLGINSLGWKLDWKSFRLHLQRHYNVSRAYIFIGFLQENQSLYRSLQSYGYILIFKQVMYRLGNKPKGNVDAELVLQAMIDYNLYDRAVIVTSDGDFACLVQYLYEQKKLERVLSTETHACSALLKKAAREKIGFLVEIREKLEYKTKN